jgi:hypothetical protein
MLSFLINSHFIESTLDKLIDKQSFIFDEKNFQGINVTFARNPVNNRFLI